MYMWTHKLSHTKDYLLVAVLIKQN